MAIKFKWSFGAMKQFETESRRILKKLDLVVDGRPVTAQPMHTGYILAQFIRIADILEAAVAATTGEKSPADIIDAYLESGNSLEQLQHEIYEKYLEANDPSSVASWREAMEKEGELKKINLQKAEARMEIARQELATLQEKAGTGQPSAAPPT